jgi:hypothetical protein
MTSSSGTCEGKQRVGPAMLIHLQGHIEKITFHNTENGFTIAKLKVPGKHEPVTVVGNLISPVPGETLSLKGSGKIIQGTGRSSRSFIARPLSPPPYSA